MCNLYISYRSLFNHPYENPKTTDTSHFQLCRASVNMAAALTIPRITDEFNLYDKAVGYIKQKLPGLMMWRPTTSGRQREFRFETQITEEIQHNENTGEFMCADFDFRVKTVVISLLKRLVYARIYTLTVVRAPAPLGHNHFVFTIQYT